jgi:hypothetical protein
MVTVPMLAVEEHTRGRRRLGEVRGQMGEEEGIRRSWRGGHGRCFIGERGPSSTVTSSSSQQAGTLVR